MCQTCGRVRCLMIDIYGVMQLLVDRAVSHSSKPHVFKLQKILSLFYRLLCNTPRIQDALLQTISVMIKFGNGRAPATSKSWPISLNNIFCVSLVSLWMNAFLSFLLSIALAVDIRFGTISIFCVLSDSKLIGDTIMLKILLIMMKTLKRVLTAKTPHKLVILTRKI